MNTHKTNFIIFITGLAASGKTTFSQYLSEKLQVLCVSKNYIKEILSDTIGFTNRAENQKLSAATYELMRHIAGSSMRTGLPIILEKSFFEQEDTVFFNNAIQKYGYKAIAVIFTGDRDALYERYKKREMSSHPAHKSFEMTREFFDSLPDAQEHFEINSKKLVVDTTDFTKICYDEIIANIEIILKTEETP
ncbi:MAG: ATP-binding protein [Firmicutes bacterium]|nr:ATP-binding protein [Bacillota bacterium]